MPLYEYECPEHGYFDRWLPVEEYNVAQKCDCGKDAKKLLSRPMVHVRQDICYDSPIDGRPITSWKARKEDLERSGCVEYDPEIKKDYNKRLVEGERNLDKQVDQTVDAMFESMPTRKREKLESELSSGATADVVRSTPTN